MARIRSIKPELPMDVAAEIRGFFYGEGHLDLTRQGSTTKTVSPRARVSLRDDDRAVVEWLQFWLGGSISYSCPRLGERAACWQLTGRENVSRLLDVLESGSLPSKKRQEVALLREAMRVRASERQSHVSPQVVARLHEIRDELKRVRRFRGAA
jgi:hypothetical protein